MEYILSIDQGTTGSRAIIYDKQGRNVASAYQEFTQYFPNPGWVEHAPKDLWLSVNNSMQEVLQKIPKGKIAAIGITNQRETTVIWDRDTGEPLYNAICWQCRRTSERCEQLKKQKGASKFFMEKTGLPIDAYFSGTKIEWILKNVPGAESRSRKGKLCFGTTDSWILGKLTGSKVHATDHTNASRTMLFNIEKLKWENEILKEFAIPEQILPQVLSSSGIFGRSIKIGRLPAGIPISGIAGDQQAALFGQACFEPGSVKNTYGTGAFILLNVGQRRPVSRHGLIVTLGCGVSGGPVYVLEGSVFIAGAAIQWLRDGLKIIRYAAESKKIAGSIKNNAGVYFVPALVGLGAPYWDQNARGSIFGLTRGTNRAHLVRAALEAICYQTKDVLEAMQKDSGIKIKSLKVDGGAAVNNFLLQFQSDILRTEVIRPKVVETTSLGAAYLAGLAIGYWKNAEEIKECWRMDRVFRPKMAEAAASNLYNGWLEAVRRSLSDFSQEKHFPMPLPACRQAGENR